MKQFKDIEKVQIVRPISNLLNDNELEISNNSINIKIKENLKRTHLFIDNDFNH